MWKNRYRESLTAVTIAAVKQLTGVDVLLSASYSSTSDRRRNEPTEVAVFASDASDIDAHVADDRGGQVFAKEMHEQLAAAFAGEDS